MNLESMRPVPKKLITEPEILGRVCWNLANKLTNEKWVLDATRNMEFSRSLKEQVGGVATYTEDAEIQPVFNGIHAEFYGTKHVVEGYKGNPADFDTYRLVLAVNQSIDQSEIPPNVLEEIFEAKGDESDDDSDGVDSIFDVIERDNLDSFEIIREQVVRYDVSGNGDIDTYDLTYTYSIDEEEVHEASYSSEYGMRITAPVTLAETGEEVDRKPAITLLLTNAELEREVKNMDESLYHLAFAELASFGAQDQEQHRHQALAIISLLGSGLFSLKDLARSK